MKVLFFPLLAYLILAAVGAGMAWADDGAATSIDDLKQLMADKKYHDVVQKTSRALTAASHGPLLAADPNVDRYALLMLKAEAQLQLKQHIVAAETFALAAKQAKDPKDAALALATSELARKSPNLKYVPASKGSSPIDISDSSDRTLAFTALYGDMITAHADSIRDAARATSLPSLVTALKNYAKMHALEIASTGADTQTAALFKILGSHALDLMYSQLNVDASTVGKIRGHANSTTELIVDGVGSVGKLKNGLSAKDKQQLNDVIADCQAIAPSAKEMADATDDDTLKKAVDDVDLVYKTAVRVLTDNYGPNGGGSY